QSITTLQQQTVKPFEIIIVNNASTDDTAIMVKKNFPQIRLINLSSNTGVTGGRNKGLEVSKGDYVLFFDHDMDAEPDMLEEILQVAESDDSIGIVTPKIYFWDDKQIIWSAGTDINLWTGQVLFHGGKDHGQFSSDKEVAIAPAVLLVKREVLDKIGGFDDIYFATYEDTDFCFKAKKAGYITYYAAKAQAYHRIPYDDTLAMKRLLDRTYWVARNRIIFMKRFGKSFPVFLCFLPAYGLYYILLAVKFHKINAIKNYITGTFAGFSI
ncbi:MAG TPA: glycosyltransferase family 2 protein, partial [Candidatus Saccharimonadales bacterium]|nr:glycosyltransferase family 2 protein [Candidatus Saccharimonadales bacterium]